MSLLTRFWGQDIRDQLLICVVLYLLILFIIINHILSLMYVEFIIYALNWIITFTLSLTTVIYICSFTCFNHKFDNEFNELEKGITWRDTKD